MMKYDSFFKKAKPLVFNSMVASSGLLLSYMYCAAFTSAYREHMEHVAKFPNRRSDSTFFSRLVHTYFSNIPFWKNPSVKDKQEAVGDGLDTDVDDSSKKGPR